MRNRIKTVRVRSLKEGTVRFQGAPAAMRELKKLSDETGLFESISDDEIEQSQGLTYQDVTALKDPMAGIVDTVPFDVAVADSMTVDYKGQRRDEKGRFTFGKLREAGKSYLKKGSSHAIMSKQEVRRVSSGILTDHPTWKPGEIRRYEYGQYQYHLKVVEPGSYNFISRKKLK